MPMNPTDDARLDALRAWLHALPPDLASVDLDTLTRASDDAGSRRYFRLRGRVADGPGASGAAGTLIAVDAPPPEKTREFVAVRALLAEAGVAVPAIYAASPDDGFMLLEDFGDQPYLAALREATPTQAADLLHDAFGALQRWQSHSRPDVLPAFDEAFLRREMELMPEWFLGRHLGLEVDDTIRGKLAPVFDALVANALAQPRVFMHRDFMPRNLMVREGDGNPGVLDFQDAVYGPVTYDAISLLRDGFISWEEDFELDCLIRYWSRARAAGVPVDPDFGEYYRQAEWMGLQRHLKILGLFCRLNYRDGKSRYLADLPRFLGYARRVGSRYQPLFPLVRLLDSVEGRLPAVGYTF
ncbi:aminoglycoside phosphotransferase family protein [Chitinasiproducens palmae]|uniref:Aminoglycoside phosphotransferase domain-containing protein n=1 Tax=Chitinasiproducens palmae TaxID=1770053 RepID=A0A1H2PN87_9BURK|nr:phosphotransferase [Chitinasiproducens palmae]SDV48115.1 hypothetical protein SAMN05216551_104170 [Chitinasiproducens palmae]